jgi:hypothetical protein
VGQLGLLDAHKDVWTTCYDNDFDLDDLAASSVGDLEAMGLPRCEVCGGCFLYAVYTAWT